MPIDLSLYPKNWNQIALSIKQSANWRCEECGRPCRPPGISQKDTEQWLKDNYPEWLPQLYKDVEDDEGNIVKIPKSVSYTHLTLPTNREV